MEGGGEGGGGSTEAFPINISPDIFVNAFNAAGEFVFKRTLQFGKWFTGFRFLWRNFFPHGILNPVLYLKNTWEIKPRAPFSEL